MSWVPTVSPSQIEAFNLCERKWAFQTVAKVPFVQNIGAWRGDTGHKMLEAFGRDRTPPERLADAFALEVALNYSKDLDEKHISATDYVSRIVGTVNKMTPLYPDPPWPAIEREFKVEIQGVTWAGRKDLEFPGVEGAINDHKFLSSPEYAQTDLTLPFNPQALTYAFEKLYRESLPQVTVKFYYGHISKSPRAWIVQHTFTPEEAVENIRPHNEIAKQIVKLRLKGPNPLDLTPNWLACVHMGGCQFQDRCCPTPEQLIEAHAAKGLGEPPTKPTGDTKMEGGLLTSLMTPGATNSAPLPATTNQTPAAALVGSTAERSDSAGAIADMIKDAKNLLRLQIPRADVVKAMCQRYVGIAHVVDSLVPLEVETAPTPAPAVNSGPPPGATTGGPATTPTPSGNVDKPVEDKPARTRLTKPAPSEDVAGVLKHVANRILEETDAGKAAGAALALIQAFKAL